MTRGEALLAMEGGARVRATDSHFKPVLQIVDGELRQNLTGNSNPWEVFGTYEEYELVPEPDTALKIVMEMQAKCPLSIESKDWMEWRDEFWSRAAALRRQMDGEK